MGNESILQMKNIDKRFYGVHALRNFSFECKTGEVHVLMGENGAGKSTLLNILGGVYHADSGEIYIKGEHAVISTPIVADALGVTVIHQELSLCKNMTIAENIYRGQEPTKPPFGFVDFNKMNRLSQELLDRMNMNLKATTYVSELSIAQQQMVEIAGALSKNAIIVVMDEPTASLSEKEIKSLFDTIDTLKARGVAIIYVSHRMNETFEIGDRVTVMRDGQFIGTKDVKDTNANELVEMMVGRSIDMVFGKERPIPGDVVLEVKNFNNKKLKNVSFQLNKGEILGFSGLVGAGRTELARAVFGLDRIYSGELIIEGKPVVIKRPSDAIKYKIGLVPEDRKGAGLVLMNTFAFNLTLTVLDRFIKGISVDRKKEQGIINKYKNSLSIRASGPEQVCANLSGGNQQKVVISKWLATESKYFILDEPTRGVDVATKSEIYDLMNALTKEGVSIIFISSDLPEIVNLSSRVVIMREGRVAGMLDSRVDEITQVSIMKYATGGM